jgi:hypothetical protein
VRAQPPQQLGGVAALGRAQRVGVPFGRVAVARGHEGGLAALREAHVVVLQIGVHLLAQRQDMRPLLLGVGLGDARRLVHARDLHVVAERHLTLVHQALHGRGARGLRRAGQRNMPLAREQARGRVQPYPARAGQKHLAPGVQVGKVFFGAARAVDGLDVGRELDQIARDEARREPQVAQQLHQQPAAVAARAARQLQRGFRALHARLHADGIGHVGVQALVELDQKVYGAAGLEVCAREIVGKQRRERLLGQVGREFECQRAFVAKRKLLGVGLEKKSKGL